MTGRSANAATFRVGDWTAEPAANRLVCAGREVKVEPKVMRVLSYLVERHGEVVTRHDLEAHVWAGMIVTDDAVTNTVIKLRKALGDNARDPRYIETIAKAGYRLIADTAGIAASTDEGAAYAADTGRDVTGPQRQSLSWSKVLILGLLVLLGVWVFWITAAPPLPEPHAAGPNPDKPVIAVLPFENPSADPEQNYFSDGITEDLITDLSKIAGLRVVARNSSFAYRGSTEPEQQIGAELHARYILNGSVRRDKERLRINVRLTDARDGSNRWAERYDRRISDIFHLQDEITNRVVGALQVELSTGDRARLTRDYATSIEAYDLFLRGLEHFGRRSSDDTVLAKEYFEQAIAIEPDFARAYAGLALTYTANLVNGWGTTLQQSLAKAESLTSKAKQLDDRVPQVYFVSGLVEMYRRNYAAALDDLARAIELKPSYADAHALLAWVLHFAGRPQEGLAAMQRAIDLNPRVPTTYWLVQGALYYELGENAEATRVLQLAVQNNPSYQSVRMFLAAAYAADQNLEEAAWQIEEIRTLDPDFTLGDVERGAPIRDPRYKQRLLRDLERAGLSR